MPALTWTWATNPGTRIAPSVGLQATGFVPSTPISAENVNYLIGELRDGYSGTVTAFEAQHNGTTGVHTAVTATSVQVSGSFTTAGSGDYLVNFPSGGGGLPFLKYALVTQSDALGGTVNGSVVQSVFSAQRTTAIRIEPGQSCRYVLGQHAFNTDLQSLILNMGISNTDTYDLDWDLQYFNFATRTWVSLVTATANAGLGGTGTLTGVAGVTDLVARTITFADQGGPFAAGNGFHLSSAYMLALFVDNNDPMHDAFLYAATTTQKAVSLTALLGAT